MSLTDKNATENTKKLYSYLQNVISDGKVIFGHQNANWIHVSKTTDSDVRELTGVLPKLVGIDTLALSGYESTLESPEKAMEYSLEVAKKAYSEGAILTLSSHAPNFSSKNIQFSNGKYDFTRTDFMDTKDKSNECVKNILSEGKLREKYLAYLDLVVEFASELAKDDIPLIFRPWHENNGEWFWWGSDVEKNLYISLFKDTRAYLENKNIHNLIYVYSPNGPFSSAEEYMERYPGDDVIDIMAFDYYDDYHFEEPFRNTFFIEMEESCKIIETLSKEHNKIPAISECGVRVAKDKEEKDLNGFLSENNPMTGHKWFQKIGEIAIEHKMPYFLVWGNFESNNHYLPYKKADGTFHDMTPDFLDFYNWEKSIFCEKK